MGRRKIEIQPITNERNRSVTFLKRKNGLFKKAHELGVLCSVDVAVIIFDERHGHDPKLYQYSSGDVREIVQRHLRHNGERDTRGPGDFSGEGGGAKNDSAAGEGDDDDDEGDIEEPAPPPKRTTSKGNKDKDDDEFKPSPGARMITESELKQKAPVSNQRSASNPRSSISAPMPPPHLDLPISSDRLHPAQHQHQHQRPYQDHDHPVSKKQRLDYSLDLTMPREHGHSGHPISPEDPLHRTHEALYMYPTFRRPSSESGQHGHPATYPYGLGPLSYSSSPPPSAHPPYAFSPSSHSEFSLASGHGLGQVSSWVRTHGHEQGVPDRGGGGGGLPPSFFGPPSSSSFNGISSFVGRGIDNGRGEPSFAHTFLEADLQHQHLNRAGRVSSGLARGGGGGSSAFGIDWPTHRSSLPPGPIQASGSGSGSGPGSGRASSTATPTGGGPGPAIAPGAKPDAVHAHAQNGVNGTNGSISEHGPASAGTGAPDDPDAAGAGWLELLSEAAPPNAKANAGPDSSAGAARTPITTPPPRSGSAASAAGSGG